LGPVKGLLGEHRSEEWNRQKGTPQIKANGDLDNRGRQSKMGQGDTGEWTGLVKEWVLYGIPYLNGTLTRKVSGGSLHKNAGSWSKRGVFAAGEVTTKGQQK